MQSWIGLLILRHGCFTPEENMSNINAEKVAIVEMNSSLLSICACLFFRQWTCLFQPALRFAQFRVGGQRAPV